MSTRTYVLDPFFKCKFVLDWNQGLAKLDFDTEDQDLFRIFSYFVLLFLLGHACFGCPHISCIFM